MGAPVVIVGTGLAGYNLAKEWRKLDADTPLLLLSADDGRVYSKPMLSTAFAKDKDVDALVTSEPGAMAEQLKAEIRTHTRVTAIEPAQRRLWLGETPVDYRDLVLAVGAEPIRVAVAGDAADSILAVNDLEDYARLRAALVGKSRVLIMGAGLIGCEFANDLSLGGYSVEVIAPCEHLMPTLVPAEAADAVQGALEALGVRFHLGPVLTRLWREGAALCAELSNGEVVQCDAVVSAVGLRARTELAATAHLPINRGVVVDRLLRAADPHIYALGDCAEIEGLNLMYVMPLMACARALAKTLAGEPTAVSYGAMPVMVKTPACPLVVATPPVGRHGVWDIEGQGADIKAVCRDEAGNLLGYALTGAAGQEKLALNRQLPAVLA